MDLDKRNGSVKQLHKCPSFSPLYEIIDLTKFKILSTSIKVDAHNAENDSIYNYTQP